jgi:hypothetical protein
MEGYLESFLYLLITIVILVLSLRKKKPVHPEGREGEEGEEVPRTSDPFSDMFRDEEEEEEYDDEPQPVKESSPWVSDKEAQRLLIDADQVMKEAAENNPIAELEGLVVKDAYELDQPESQDQGISFDLKKAVIYYEILEKRTF